MGTTNEEIFSGYTTIGVCIMSPNYFCVSLEQDEEQANGSVWSRFCVHDLEDEVGDRWANIEFEGGWVTPKVVHTEFEEFLISDGIGQVYYNGLGNNKQIEKPITDNKCGIRSLKNINGKIFGVDVARAVYQRTGGNQWHEYTEFRNIPGHLLGGLNNGFRAIDGFSESDIYAVGGDRDVWHFDGEEWSPMDIGRRPFRCECVVCAEDGYVYIGGWDGVIVRGRGDVWKTNSPEKGAEDFHSIASYRGRVFVGTEEGTFIVKEDLTLEPYDFEGQIRPIAGTHMYAAYDRLLIANAFNQVAFFDGEKWLDINGCGELTPVEEARLLHQKLKLIEEAKEKSIGLMDVKE